MQLVLPDGAWKPASPPYEERHHDAKLWDPKNPQGLALGHAIGKAESTAKIHPEKWVLACDQIVILDGQPLHKVSTHEKAVHILERLRNHTALNVTGVAIVMATKAGQCLTASVACSDWVRFKDMSTPNIEAYVRNYRPFDCVGCCNVSTPPMQDFIDFTSVQDPTNLQGFPVGAIRNILGDRGFKLTPLDPQP